MKTVKALIPGVAFFLLLLGVATACLTRPIINGDQFIQAVAAETLFGATADQAYSQIHTEMGSMYGEFLPRSTVIALIPLHTVKVLHIAAIGLFERAGIPMHRAVILETCSAYVLIGVVVWLWLGVYLSAWSQAVLNGVVWL
jgi:hypothetical protein